MGYWYSELIPPAILFDHPRITVDKYTSKLKSNEVHLLHPFDPYILPPLLRLPYTQSYKDFKTPEVDSNGLEVFKPYISSYDQPYTVTQHLRNELHPSQEHELISSRNIQNNRITPIGIPYEQRTCLVNEILKKEIIFPNENTSNYYEDNDPGVQVFRYKFIGQEIEEIYDEEQFDSVDSLFTKWPQFRPENVFDFTVNQGRFRESNIGIESFGWKSINGRYYFDELSFDRIPEGGSIREKGVGYTDLVITAEVVKKKQTGMIGGSFRDWYNEDKLENFLKRFPSSRKRVDLAIWDAHTSIYAKQNGLSHLELIRLRLGPHSE